MQIVLPEDGSEREYVEKDDILPVEDAAAFERDLQDCAGVDVIPGSGHSPHLDNPEPVTASIRAFLETL